MTEHMSTTEYLSLGKRRIRNRPEEDLHKPVAAWLDANLVDAWCCHVPNGGGRSKAEGAAFKAMGVKPGVPDHLIIHKGRAYWIELKPEKYRNHKNGGLSANQVLCHAILKAAGCKVATCYTLEEVQETVRAWKLVKACHGVDVVLV